MSKYGCPGMFIAMVRLFHESMQARVQDNGTEPFSVSNGVKQGSVLAPTLFSLKFSAMLNDAFCAERVGVDISHRTDGQLFNPRRLNAKTKTKPDSILDLLFAEDCN